MKICGIYNYLTTNILNGKQYVGTHATFNPQDSYLGSGTALKRAIKKYGKENFTKEIICSFDNVEEAFINEGLLIEKYKTLHPYGYNISPKGGHAIKGGVSKETRELISASNREKPKSEKHRAALKLAWQKRKLTPVSETTKRLMSESQKRVGNKPPVRYGNKDRLGSHTKYSEESKLKMRKPKSEIHRQHIKDSWKKRKQKQQEELLCPV